MHMFCVKAGWTMLAGATAAAMLGGAATGVLAQVQLPGIVVTTPSPVAKPKTPSSKTAPAAPEAPQSPPAADVPVEDTFVPLTVITAEQIASTPGATLTDALQSMPGITGSTFAPGANRPIIRGLDNHRVLVQENGIGSHDVSALSEDHAVPIDPLSIDRIEVVRGPATLRYGSQAIGGVVNAFNGRIPEIVPPKGISFATRGGSSSVDGGADGAFKVTAGSGNFAVYADGFRRHSGDYDTTQGRQFNTFVDSEGFAVGTSFIVRNGYLGVAFSRVNSLYGIPDSVPGDSSVLDERPRIDLKQDKLQSRGEWRVRDHGVEAIRFWLGSSWYAHDELHSHEGEDEVASRFKNRQTEGRVEVQHLPVMTGLGELRGAVGVQFGRKRVAALSFEETEEEGVFADNLIDPASTSTVAAFWFEELQLTRRLRLQGATRIEQTAVDGTGLFLTAPNAGDVVAVERRFMPVSAGAGLLYDLPWGVVARLTGQYVERAPADAELFSKGVHEATGTFEIGNPDLTEEKAQTFELGFRKAAGPFRFDVSAYYTRFNGFIFKGIDGTCDATLDTCGPANGELDRVLYRQRNATFYGLELLGELDIGRVWRGTWGIDGRYDLVRASFDDAEGGNVARIPPHRAGAGVYYRDSIWFARLGFLHAFDQNRIGEGETPTEGYTLLNAELAYTFKLDRAFAPEMTIGLKGENLLDDDVRNHVSFKKDEVLEPGRTIRLYGTVKLN
jgi:iron complex outermembrane receptor protein